jgi:Ca2+-binding EF-hand superfamily protein
VDTRPRSVGDVCKNFPRVEFLSGTFPGTVGLEVVTKPPRKRQILARRLSILEVSMIRFKAFVAVAAAFLLTINTADAADKKAKKANKAADKTTALFKKLDTNSDGKVSKDEFAKLKEATKALKAANPKKKAKAAKPAKVKKGNKAKKGNKKGNKSADLFKKLDTNNDGSLSATEFAKIKEVKKAAKAANPKKKKKAKK